MRNCPGCGGTRRVRLGKDWNPGNWTCFNCGSDWEGEAPPADKTCAIPSDLEIRRMSCPDQFSNRLVAIGTVYGHRTMIAEQLIPMVMEFEEPGQGMKEFIAKLERVIGPIPWVTLKTLLVAR